MLARIAMIAITTSNSMSVKHELILPLDDSINVNAVLGSRLRAESGAWRDDAKESGRVNVCSYEVPAIVRLVSVKNYTDALLNDTSTLPSGQMHVPQANESPGRRKRLRDA